MTDLTEDRCNLAAGQSIAGKDRYCELPATHVGLHEDAEYLWDTWAYQMKNTSTVLTCPTPCDPDCASDCHEWHKADFRRSHVAGTCLTKEKRKRSQKRHRTVIVGTRFRPDEIAAIEAVANGTPISTFLRECALAAATSSKGANR